MQMLRRDALRLCVSSAGMALLAACTGAGVPAARTGAPPVAPNPPAPAPPAATPATAATPTSAGTAAAQTAGVVVPAPQAAGQAKSGGALRMGIVGDLPSLDGNDFGAAIDVTYPVFNDLGQKDEKLNLNPE